MPIAHDTWWHQRHGQTDRRIVLLVALEGFAEHGVQRQETIDVNVNFDGCEMFE